MNGLNFGVFLHNVRNSRHLTIERLSELSGISGAQISRIEANVRGTPKPATIKKLADALSVSYERMLGVAGYITTRTQSPPVIGKAGDIRTVTVERHKINNGMGTIALSEVVNDWLEKNNDKQVIDIKPTENFALIIYKQDVLPQAIGTNESA